MSTLFGKGRTTITEHIGNIFNEGEFTEEVVCRDFRHTTQHGAIEGGFEGEGNIDEDPLFTNVEINYFTLQWSSPYKNTGTSFFVSDSVDTLINLTEFDYIGSAPDMGPY